MAIEWKSSQISNRFFHRGDAAINEAVQRFGKPPSVLYHYTGTAGLTGIASSGNIYATDIRYLNDSSEIEHPVRLVQEMIRERIADAKQAAVRMGLDSLLPTASLATQSEVYVVSLSTHGDRLSQWRGYCPRGSGYAIGFHMPTLHPILLDQGFNIFPCIYSLDHQKQLLTAIVDDIQELIVQELVPFEAKGEVPLNLVTAIRTQFYAHFMVVAPMLKHPTFHEEGEWRFVSHSVDAGDAKLGYRPGAFTLVPYYPLSLLDKQGKCSVERLYVGPTPNSSLAAAAAERYLRTTKCVVGQIMSSDVPERTV